MKRFLCLIMSMLCSYHAFSQQPKNAGQATAQVMRSITADPQVRAVLVDSLNARYPMAVKQKLVHLERGKLNDSALTVLYAYLQQSGDGAKLQRLKKQAAVLKDTARLKAYLDSKLRGFYALEHPLPILPDMRKIAVDNQFKTVGISAVYDNGGAAVIQAGYTAQFSDEAVVGNIPFKIDYTNLSGHSSFAPGFSDQNLAKISFDKAAYQQRLASLVASHYDLKKYFLQDIDLGASIKGYASLDLKSLESNMDSLYRSKAAAMGKLVAADQLLYLDSVQLRNAVISGRNMADSSEARATNDYLQHLYALKKKYGDNAAADVLNFQSLQNKKTEQWMQEESQQVQADKSLLPLNGLQKLFLKAQSLNLGNFGAGGSRGMVSGLFMKGIQGTFMGNNNKTLMAGIGTRQDMGALKDAPFTGSLEGSGYMMEMLQMGKGMPDQPHSLVGAVNANSKNNTTNQFSTLSLPRNIFTGTFSKNMKVGNLGTLDAELGKSSNSFANATVGSDMASAGKAAVTSLLSDFWQTFSAGLDFNGNVDEWKLDHHEYISYAGMAYNNPASPFISRGTIRYGLGLKKGWYHNKLLVGVKLDQRTIHNTPDGGDSWHNQQYSVDVRYKLQRNFTLTARLNQSMMKNPAAADHSNDFVSRQFSMSSQSSMHLWGKVQSDNMTLGVQQMNVGYLHSVLVNMNLNHNILLGTNVVSVNVFYNKDLKDNALYGNMFNTEALYNYTLLKTLNMGSGLTYLSDAPVVRQAGIKQTFTASLAKKLSTTLYLDCRKNLHNTPQNYLYGTFHGEMAVRYTF